MFSFTRMYDYFKLFIVITAISLLISCGGGGGGGGGGSASGPADEASEEDGSPSPSQPAPIAQVPDNNTTPISFTFSKGKNPALASCEQDIYTAVIDETSSAISLSLPFGTDRSSLIPDITLPANASISPEASQAQDFTSPVIYTVTAADGTTSRDWTVNVEELPSTQHVVNYILDGGEWIAEVPSSSFNEDESITLRVRGELAKENYIFTGWHEGSPEGSIITGWNAHQKTTDISIYATWAPAPAVNRQLSEIYANGLNLLIISENGGTALYIDENANGLKDSGEPSLYDVNNLYPANGENLSNYTIYGGNASNVNSPNVTSTNLTFKGGKVANVYGGNRNGSLPSGTRKVTVTGTAEIGDKNTRGVYLRTLTDNKVIAKDLSSAQAKAFTLIGANNNLANGTVVATYENASSDAGKFCLTNENFSHKYNVNSSGNNIIIIGEVALPSNVVWENDTFTLGEGNITTDGTIFSVFASGGYFTVTETSLAGATFDMGIPLKADNRSEDGYVSSLNSSKHYRYIQFKSNSGNISSSAADSYLSHIVFHKVDSKVTVRINLETVEWSTITAADVTYFDGSFYKAYNEHLTWSAAYAKAKEKTFNGLKGYLMTITSEAENKFIYDKLFKNKGVSASNASAWLGATRANNSAGGFDANSWTHNGYNSYWNWTCGPEAGQKFYDKAKRSDGGNVVSGFYENWNSGEPNDSGTEFCAQYCGTYIWNDLNNVGNNSPSSQYHVKNYVVEFRPYSTSYGAQSASKTALSDQKDYSN